MSEFSLNFGVWTKDRQRGIFHDLSTSRKMNFDRRELRLEKVFRRLKPVESQFISQKETLAFRRRVVHVGDYLTPPSTGSISRAWSPQSSKSINHWLFLFVNKQKEPWKNIFSQSLFSLAGIELLLPPKWRSTSFLSSFYNWRFYCLVFASIATLFLLWV